MKRFNVKSYLAGIVTIVLILSIANPVSATIAKRTFNANYNDIKISLNGKTITPKDVNGNIVEPFTVNGTTYLPVRAVGNALGIDVDWDNATKTVILTDDQTASTWTDEAFMDLVVYHSLYILGDAQDEILDALDMLFDAINLNNSDYDSYISYCDTTFETVHAYEEEMYSYCTTDAQIAVFEKFLESEGKLVEVKQAALNYKSYKSDTRFDAYQDAYIAAYDSIRDAKLAAENGFSSAIES